MAMNTEAKIRREIARSRELDARRDGLVQRSVRIESAKGYKRSPKHRNRGWE